MSKIKTNYIEPRVSDSTVTIGTKDGHVRIIGKSVEIQGHPNDVEIGNILEGYESLYIYITRDEFKKNSNKCFIRDAEPDDNPDAKFPVKPGDVWLNNDLKNWRVYSIKNDVGAWRVPQIETDVQKLKEDVVALEGEIEALITLDEKGSWEATFTEEVESGQVYFSTPDFTSQEITVRISKTDTDSNSHMFSTMAIGTWIEFIEDDADYCLGQVALFDNEDEDFFEATLDVSVGKGEVVEESNIKIRAFEATEFDPASIRIVDIDDKPPVEPNEGDLWFDNNSSDMTLRVFQQASDAWLAVAPATTIEGRVTAGEATQASIQAAQVEMQKTIDNALIEQAKLSEALNANSMPGLSFIYQSGSSNVKENHFLYWGSGSSSRMRLSAKAENIDWLDDGLNFDYTMEDGPYFTIWFLDVNSTGRPKWKMKAHGRVSRIDWHNNDALVYISSQQTNGLLGADISYNITIGGVM